MTEQPVAPEEWPQPETVEVVRPTQVPAPPEPLNEWRLMSATVGDVLSQPSGDPIPDGWLKCEAVELQIADWPEFAEALGFHPGDTSFTLPEGKNTDVQTAIIKMR